MKAMLATTPSRGLSHLQRIAGLSLAALAVILVTFAAAAPVDAQTNPNVRPPAGAVQNATPGANPNVRLPGETANTTSVIPAPKPGGNFDPNMWSRVRDGMEGNVSIPDKKAGVLVQTAGADWRLTRTGELPRYGAYAMAAMLALLALFFLMRGRIKIEEGRAGRTITRFTDLERMAHWLLAVSFIILGLTGLNILYGRDFLIPVIGKEAFASLAMLGKWLHNYVAFAFMAGLALTFVIWIRNNIPSLVDLKWLAKGGGMFSKHSHPPAAKFNAGQKILFWLIILGGISISLSGLSLMFPFQIPVFEKTFAFLNLFGAGLPATLTPMEEMQYANIWHSIVAVFLVCVIFGHIYIGTIGMEGAFDAMGSGEVDLNWAKDHHSLWVDEVTSGQSGTTSGGGTTGAKPVPAE